MSKKHLLLYILLTCMVLPTLGGDLKNRYPRSVLEKHLIKPGTFEPVPRASDPYWQKNVPKAMRDSYIRVGETYLGKPWQAMRLDLFKEFKANGNRINYENVCFEKRRQLSCLAMAEIIEGKGRFMNDIVKGLQSMLEETWWGIPAHYSTDHPVRNDQTVDLFNAETANLMVWIRYMLRDQLNKKAPKLCDQIRDEVKRRVLQPVLKENYWWKRAGNNWNPWICSNWLNCVMFCETDRKLQLDAVEQIIGCLDTFMDSYPADGGCDEGPGYWNRAAASLYDALYILRVSTGGFIDLSNDQKLKNMGSFIYKTYIGGGQSVNFADNHGNNTANQADVIYTFGMYINDATMRGFARSLWKGDNKAGDEFRKRGNFTTLGREMIFLSMVDRFEREKVIEPNNPDNWLPNLQIMTARDQHLFLAMKGGHNDESHNHNDVGSFIVYGDNRPVLIDPSVGSYTAATFGNNRYAIWTMQSGYHNLPQINGVDQHEGKDYKARNVIYKPGVLTMDIAGAYPADAAVKSWVRQTQLVRGQYIEIKEDYELKKYVRPTKIMLLTTTRPKIKGGKITLGNYEIQFNKKDMNASFENISDKLDRSLQNLWGKEMYRIVLTIKGKRTKGTITYKIVRR